MARGNRGTKHMRGKNPQIGKKKARTGPLTTISTGKGGPSEQRTEKWITTTSGYESCDP